MKGLLFDAILLASSNRESELEACSDVVHCLLLLCGTRNGRERLREMQVVSESKKERVKKRERERKCMNSGIRNA